LAMQFVSRRPSPQLEPFVSQLWYFDGNDFASSRERRLPSTTLQLVINLHDDSLRWWDGEALAREHELSGAAVSGVYVAPFAIATQEQRRVIGAVFRPGAAPALLGVPAHELADTHVELEALWGADARRQRRLLLDAESPGRVLETFDRVLCARIEGAIDPLIAFAVRALERGCSVAQVARAVELGGQRLRQRFSAAVGVTPKAYARIARLQRVLVAAARPARGNWAQLAVESGYFDQAHLIQDFRSLTGLTPSGYHPRAPDDLRHVLLE
jgi:AraC-like DNA-binding protein